LLWWFCLLTFIAAKLRSVSSTWLATYGRLSAVRFLAVVVLLIDLYCVKAPFSILHLAGHAQAIECSEVSCRSGGPQLMRGPCFVFGSSHPPTTLMCPPFS
jgi:hypothetical protein